jgi:hypothetical protein
VLSKHIGNTAGVEVFGNIRNEQGVTLNDLRVGVTFYDASGNVVWVEQGIPDTGLLAPGKQTTYHARTGRVFSYARFVVQAEGAVAN